MTKKKINVHEGKNLILEKIELELDSKLPDIRKKLENEIKFDYIFLNEDEEEIKKEEESEIKLSEILDGKNLHLKKSNI